MGQGSAGKASAEREEVEVKGIKGRKYLHVFKL